MGLARRVLAVAGAGVALVIGAHPAAAQGNMGVTPWVGIYVPTSNSFSFLGNDIKRKNSLVGGLRLTLWGKSSLGLEFSAGYSPAKVEIAGTTINEDRKTNVFLGAVKLMLGSSPATGSGGVFLGLGPAVIRQGHDVSAQSSSRTDIGGVGNVGIRLPLGKAVSVRFDVEDYFYGGHFDGSKSFQNDLGLSAGLSLFF